MILPLFMARRYQDRNGPATRQEILNLLARQPGMNKSQLCRALGLAWGTVSHHVRLLREQGHVVCQGAMGRVRVFMPGTATAEMALMPLLRQEPVARILQLLDDRPGQGIQDLSRRTAVSRKVVRRVLLSLEEVGLVQRVAAYRPRFYRACPGEALCPLPADLQAQVQAQAQAPALAAAPQDTLSRH